MEPLDDAAPPSSRPSPADIDLPSTTAITIDIAQLLNARARTSTKLDVSEFEHSVPLARNQRFEPVLGLISRSLRDAVNLIELPHLRVLVLLSQRDSMSVGELANLMNSRSRAMFALLDSMEASGWIGSHSQARGMGETITITQQGQSVIDSITEQRQHDIDEILGRVSDEDRVGLARAFNSFAAAAGEAPIRRPRRGIAP